MSKAYNEQPYPRARSPLVISFRCAPTTGSRRRSRWPRGCVVIFQQMRDATPAHTLTW